MRKIYGIILTSGLIVSGAWADLDCPADSAIHVDTRTMLPDGSPTQHTGKKSQQVCVVVWDMSMVLLWMGMK